MLPDQLSKIKGWMLERENDLLTTLIIIVVSVGSFGLGRLSAVYDAKTPIVIKNAVNPSSLGAAVLESVGKESAPTPAGSNLFIASKNGTKYYPEGCPAAKRISPANLVYFASAAEAERGGYRLAAGCN